ncbi:MAG TPA: ADP-ribosylglycohydrolase family protein, partial [Sedimentisphaerales bacterium]
NGNGSLMRILPVALRFANEPSERLLEFVHRASVITHRHPRCAMLPFCERHVSVPRNDVAPIWTRSFPISKEPTTLGQHLKKKRFGAEIRQSEAAQILGVSTRSLSLWECDWLFPTAPYHARIIKYMGYDPFKKLRNDVPNSQRQRNPFVAFLLKIGRLLLAPNN